MDNYGYACTHIINAEREDLHRYFMGKGFEYHLLCGLCAKDLSKLPETIRGISEEKFRELDVYCEGVVGQPEVLVRASNLTFSHSVSKFDQLLSGTVLSIQSEKNVSESCWVAVLSSNEIVRLNFSTGIVTKLCDISPDVLKLTEKTSIHLAPNSALAAVVNDYQSSGAVLDLLTGEVTMLLNRGSYHVEQTPFPVVFFTSGDTVLLVHGTAWNRLDISNPRTGELLTKRDPTSYRRGEPRPDHYLDYFHSHLVISSNGHWIAEDGWVWSPFGRTRAWSLRDWLEENVWESEDGKSLHYVTQRGYHWDAPLCWINNDTLVVWGLGDDDLYMLNAVLFFDPASGKFLRWFAGPKRGDLFFDNYLFSTSSDGTDVWDIETGERLLSASQLTPHAYHHGTQQFLTVLPDNTFQLSQLVNS